MLHYVILLNVTQCCIVLLNAVLYRFICQMLCHYAMFGSDDEGDMHTNIGATYRLQCLPSFLSINTRGLVYKSFSPSVTCRNDHLQLYYLWQGLHKSRELESTHFNCSRKASIPTPHLREIVYTPVCPHQPPERRILFQQAEQRKHTRTDTSQKGSTGSVASSNRPHGRPSSGAFRVPR